MGHFPLAAGHTLRPACPVKQNSLAQKSSIFPTSRYLGPERLKHWHPHPPETCPASPTHPHTANLPLSSQPSLPPGQTRTLESLCSLSFLLKAFINGGLHHIQLATKEKAESCVKHSPVRSEIMTMLVWHQIFLKECTHVCARAHTHNWSQMMPRERI